MPTNDKSGSKGAQEADARKASDTAARDSAQRGVVGRETAGRDTAGRKGTNDTGQATNRGQGEQPTNPDDPVGRAEKTVEGFKDAEWGLDTQEEPSQLQNNIYQAIQPTRDGDIAGGEIPPLGSAGNEPPPNPAPTEFAKERYARQEEQRQANSRHDMRPDPEKAERMVTVKLTKGYVPMSDKYEIVSQPEPKQAGTGTKGKLLEGAVVKLPADEAKKLHQRGLATREFDD